VLRAGETETTQENIQDWLELGEGDPGFSASDTGRNCCSDFSFEECRLLGCGAV
jgi:hypothetical protein